MISTINISIDGLSEGKMTNSTKVVSPGRFSDNSSISQVSRRRFLTGAAAGGLLLPIGSAIGLSAQQPSGPSNETWLNEPKHWHREGTSILCTADAKTDFWRKTFYGYITDNGHFLRRHFKGDFTTSIKVTGQYHDLYDQAGLMVRVDETTWMKCGIEFVDGKQNVSVVITRDFSNWATARLPDGVGPLWMKVVRKGSALDIFHSLDGQHFTEFSVVYLGPADSVDVGPMFAAPEGKGFDVRFDDWVLKPGAAS